VLQEKSHHFARGIGAGGIVQPQHFTPAGPSMAGAMHDLVTGMVEMIRD